MRLLLALLLALPAFGALSTISDTLYSADGNANVNGSITITWPTFTTGSGTHVVPSGSKRFPIVQGVILIRLEPNDIADQSNIYYTAKYTIITGSAPVGASLTESWVVPTSATPLKLKDVRTIVSGGGSSSFPGVLSVNTNTGYVTLFTSTSPKTSTYPVTVADFKACALIPVASGTFTITLVASGSQPPNGQCIDILNYGSGVVTVARSGQLINGAAANLTIAAGSSSAPNGLHIWSNGTNYFAEPNGGSGGGGVNAVLNNQSNTYSTGAQDFGSATTLRIPTASALAPTANGLIAYDTRNNLYHFGRNGLSLIVGLLEGSFADNDLLKYKASTGGIISAGSGSSVTWKSGGTTVVTGSTFNVINLDGILKTTANSPAGTFELQLAVDRATTPTKVSSGTAALGTSAIASTACATVVTVAATGTLTTDIVSWGLNGDITAVTGYAPVTSGGLSVYVFPTANNINVKVCNPTSSSITPGAVTLNWMSQR